MAGPVRFTSPGAEQRYDALVAVAARSVVGLDFDGTLAPIVDDPDAAHIHPDAPAVLLDLAQVVRAVAVITGRPARKVLALGGLDVVGREVGESGRELFVFGQYGYERWSSTQRRVVSPRPPQGLSGFLRELPGLLRKADAGDAFVEDKGLADRRPHPPARRPRGGVRPDRAAPAGRRRALRARGRAGPQRRRDPLARHGQGQGGPRPGQEVEAGGFLFAGDDLGDVEAFDAVAELRDQGVPTLLVCSASQEESTLVDLADVVVPGPEGVLDLLRRLTADARACR